MIMHVVGNRPQLIKLAPLSRELRKRGIQDIIIHTGQHYDENMSDIFFRELGIEKPYRNLQIGSGTHGYITAAALLELEKIMMELKPDVIVVYGDTNSTLSAAIAAAKLAIPIVHVEAGPRTYQKNNPEEINRTMVDHLSTILCCPDQISADNLKKENITEGVYNTGDIMYDTFLYCKEKSDLSILDKFDVKADNYVLMTWHRQENTGDPKRMEKILDFIGQLKQKVLCPMHPRTRKMLESFGLWEKAGNIANLKIVEPLGYMEMVTLMNQCRFVLCDSGGVSKETYFAGKQCFFMLSFNPWKQLVDSGCITTIDFNDQADVEKKLHMALSMGKAELPQDETWFGKGTTAKEIVNIMEAAELI